MGVRQRRHHVAVARQFLELRAIGLAGFTAAVREDQHRRAWDGWVKSGALCRMRADAPIADRVVRPSQQPAQSLGGRSLPEGVGIPIGSGRTRRRLRRIPDIDRELTRSPAKLTRFLTGIIGPANGDAAHGERSRWLRQCHDVGGRLSCRREIGRRHPDNHDEHDEHGSPQPAGREHVRRERRGNDRERTGNRRNHPCVRRRRPHPQRHDDEAADRSKAQLYSSPMSSGRSERRASSICRSRWAFHQRSEADVGDGSVGIAANCSNHAATVAVSRSGSCLISSFTSLDQCGEPSPRTHEQHSHAALPQAEDRRELSSARAFDVCEP